MITKNDILKYLNSDSWFRPSNNPNKIPIINDNGQTVEVASSYYHVINNNAQIEIRVSDHGTKINTWVRRKEDPTVSLQNLSIIFSNDPIIVKRETQPITVKDTNGNEITKYLYFVVEQYEYRLDNLSMKDFHKIINRIKRLEQDGVFTDPFRKKPSKKANRRVITPHDEQGNKIQMPSDPNALNSRQRAVAGDENHEFDKEGNPIVDWRLRKGTVYSENRKILRLSENQFKNFLSNCIENVLKEVVEKDSYQAKPKKKGRLNDWEISNILHTIVTELISAKRITPEDGEMLLYYGLYNNDCFSHIGS